MPRWRENVTYFVLILAIGGGLLTLLGRLLSRRRPSPNDYEVPLHDERRQMFIQQERGDEFRRAIGSMKL
jgi:hypothetical protein